MRHARKWWLCVLAAAVISLATAAAQEAPDAGELEKAVQTLKETKNLDAVDMRFASRLSQARRLLVQHQLLSLRLIAPLLDENEVVIRLNAAIVLAECAEAGETSDTLIGLLKRCLRDTEPAIAYWGMVGLIAPGMSEESKFEAVKAVVEMKQPRILRMATAELVAEKKIVAAFPVLLDHISKMLPYYKEQRTAKLTRVVGESGGRGRGRDDPEGREGRGFEDRGRREFGPEGVPRGDDRFREPGRREPGRRGPRGRDLPPDARERKKPKRKVKKVIIDPEKQYYRDKEALADYITEEFLPDVPSAQELLTVGLALETLVRKNLYESPFGFATTPPWKLDECVHTAVAWYDKNKDQFKIKAPAAPEEPDKKKPTRKPAN